MRNINISFYVKFLVVCVFGPITLLSFQNCSNMTSDPTVLSAKSDSQFDSSNGTSPNSDSSSVISTSGTATTSSTLTTSNTTVISSPSSKIVFPPDSATTDATILIRGQTQTGASQMIQSVTVNGVIATTTDGYLNWKVSVPLVIGVNTLAVNVVAAGKNYSNQAVVKIDRFSSETALTRGKGYWSERIMGVTYEPTANRLIFSDDMGDGVFEAKLADGQRKLLSYSEADLTLGGGYDIVQPISVIANGQLSYVVDGNDIVKIDLLNGNRSVLTRQGSMSTLLLKPNSNDAIAVQYDLENIININLNSGSVVEIAKKSIGNGSPDIRSPKMMSASWVRNKAYLNLFYQDSLLAVDLLNGSRSVFSTAQGSEPKISNPDAMQVDEMSNQLFVWDSGQLIAIDLNTGRRKLFSSSGTFSSYKNISMMTSTPWGLILVDYIPWYQSGARSPTVILIDPVEGTRVILSR